MVVAADTPLGHGAPEQGRQGEGAGRLAGHQCRVEQAAEKPS